MRQSSLAQTHVSQMRNARCSHTGRTEFATCLTKLFLPIHMPLLESVVCDSLCPSLWPRGPRHVLNSIRPQVQGSPARGSVRKYGSSGSRIVCQEESPVHL